MLRWVVCLCLCTLGISPVWAEQTTLYFNQINGFDKWGTTYKSHIVEYPVGTVTFASADHQNGTITDVPVTKGNDVTFVMKEGSTLKALTLTCRQWITTKEKKAQTITLHTSTDGGSHYTISQITSSNFKLTADTLPSGTNAVKFTFSSKKNQIGIESLAITYTTAVDDRTPVNLTSFVSDRTTLVVGEAATTTVANDQAGWTAAYTYTSDRTNVATVNAEGVITAVAKGTATITVSANVQPDAQYKAGPNYTRAIDIEVVNPSHTVTFAANGQTVSSTSMEEGSPITFDALDKTYVPEGETFMGWTAAAVNGTQQTAPVMVNQATVGTADVTYYALFATATASGSAGWQRKSVSEVFAASDPDGTYALVTPDGHAFNGNITDGHGQVTSQAFTFVNGWATTAPEGMCELTVSKSENGIQIKHGGKYLYAKGSSSGSLAWVKSDDDVWIIESGHLRYSRTDAFLRSFENKSFRTYGSLRDGAVLYFAYRPSITYVDYCTEVDNSDRRPYVNIATWTAGQTVIVRGATLATTVTTSPAACTSATYSYQSSNPSVATISAEGVITAVGKGTATLTVTLHIADDDAQYRQGNDLERTLTVEVVNPSYTATWMANGEAVSQQRIEEGTSLHFPTATAPEGLEWLGWSQEQWDNVRQDIPMQVDATSVQMPGGDVTYYAVYGRVAQPGIEHTYRLAAEQIQAHFAAGQGYADPERSWNDGAVTWHFKGQTGRTEQNGSFLQIKTNNGSYLGIEAPYAITNISFGYTNGSDNATHGTFYAKVAPTENSSEGTIYQTFNFKSDVREASLDIEGNLTALYLQFNATTVARMRNIVVTCTTPAVYAGYVTEVEQALTVRTVQVTMAACGYTTICLPFNATAAEGAQIYALHNVAADELTFVPKDTAMAGQGYIVAGQAGENYILTEVLEPGIDTDNLLQGVVKRTAVSALGLQGAGDYAYPWILAKDGTFKRYVGEFIPAGKAYLDGFYVQGLSQGASAMRITFAEEDVTGLQSLSDARTAPAVYYTLDGRRVPQPRPGSLCIDRDRKIIIR